MILFKAVAAKIEPDPLLNSAPRLSKVVSVVEGIKKRHGTLIEDALIAAIRFVPGWTAMKSVIPRPNGSVFKPDCVAINFGTKTAYVFECKRRYTSHDEGAKKAIDLRLDEIAALFPAFAVSRGWSITDTGIFILSFYGDGGQISNSKSNRKYTVHDRRSVATLFPPCALKFTNDFIEYSERVAGQWCAEQIDPDPSSVDQVVGAQQEEGEAENPTTFDVETNLFEILDRWQFLKTDRFEVGIQGIRVIRNMEEL
jgi:hypothetical protein